MKEEVFEEFIATCDQLYREANREGRMDTPSFVYEKMEIPFNDYCALKTHPTTKQQWADTPFYEYIKLKYRKNK